MDSVFLPWYVRAPDSAEENEFFIGACSTEEHAQAAMERLKYKPGFVDAPHLFQMCPYAINRDHWTEGFISPQTEKPK